MMRRTAGGTAQQLRPVSQRRRALGTRMRRRCWQMMRMGIHSAKSKPAFSGQGRLPGGAQGSTEGAHALDAGWRRQVPRLPPLTALALAARLPCLHRPEVDFPRLFRGVALLHWPGAPRTSPLPDHPLCYVLSFARHNVTAYLDVDFHGRLPRRLPTTLNNSSHPVSSAKLVEAPGAGSSCARPLCGNERESNSFNLLL